MKKNIENFEYEIVNQILFSELSFDICNSVKIIPGRGNDFLPYYYNLNFIKGIISLHSLLLSKENRCPQCKKQHNAKIPRICKCGYKLNSEDVGKGQWYVYYHCTKKKGRCSQKYIHENILEEQIDDQLSKLELDPDFEKWAIKWFKALNQERYEIKKDENEKFIRDYEQTEVRIKRLMDMRLDGEISKEDFALKKNELELEKFVVKKRLEKADGVDREWIDNAEKEIGFIEGIRYRFKNGGVKDKRYIFTKIGSNFILKDKKLTLEANCKYIALRQLQDVADFTLEPEKMALEKGESLFDNAPYSVWLPRLGSNQ